MFLYTREEGKKSCREMDIIEFASAIGNVYVKEFSELYWEKLRSVKCELHEGGFYEQECASFHKTTSYDATRAVQEVRKHVMIFPMLELINR